MNNWRNSGISTGETLFYGGTGDDWTGYIIRYVSVTDCYFSQTAINAAIAVASVLEEEAEKEPESENETEPFIKPVDFWADLFFFVEKRKHRWTSGFV